MKKLLTKPVLEYNAGDMLKFIGILYAIFFVVTECDDMLQWVKSKKESIKQKFTKN